MGQVYKDLPIALKNPLVPWVILKCIRMTFLFLPSYIFARRNLKGYSYPENLFNFFNKIREKNRVEWSEAANRWYLASICNRFRHVYRICRIYRVASERLMRECAGGTGYQRKERRLRGSGEVKARDVRKYKRRVPARALERRARLSLSLSLCLWLSLSLSPSLSLGALYTLCKSSSTTGSPRGDRSHGNFLPRSFCLCYVRDLCTGTLLYLDLRPRESPRAVRD